MTLGERSGLAGKLVTLQRAAIWHVLRGGKPPTWAWRREAAWLTAPLSSAPRLSL